MAGINLAGTSQALDASLNTVVSEFHVQRQEAGTLRPLAREIPLKAHAGASVYVNMYSTLTAYALADGVDMQQAQSLADTQTSYTPAEVGINLIIADTTLRRVADPSLLKNIGKLMAQAYTRKEDQDGAGQFTSWSTGLGTAATVPGVGHVMSMRSSLRVGNSNSSPEPAPDPINAVFHPGHLHILMGRLIPLGQSATGGTAYGVDNGAHNGKTMGPGRTEWSDDMIKRGKKAITRVFDMDIHECANITVDSNNDAIGAAMSKEGFIFVPEMEPTEERQRDASWRAWEINMVGSYIWGLYRAAAYGIKFTGDASLPTS